MDLNTLKGLSQEEAFKWASGFSGVPANILDSLWAQESGRGVNMRSPAGARGHFQLMPGTQALFEKQLGVKVNPDDFHESLFIAAHHLKDDMRREKGNLEHALRAYNNGPKWREKEDPRGENAKYAGAIFARAGYKPGDKVAEPPVEQQAPVEFSAAKDTGLVQLGPVELAMEKAKLQSPSRDLGLGSIPDELQAERDMRVREEETSALRTAWFSAKENIAVNLADRADKPAREDGFVFESWADRDKFLGEVQPRNEEELEFIKENMNGASSAEWVKRRLGADRKAAEDYAVVGPWRAFGAMAAVGLADPVGLAIGMGLGKVAGVARAGVRAAALQGAGRGATVGRTVGVTTAEGAVGNVIWEAAQDAIGEVKSFEDYALAGAFGGSLGALVSIPAMRGAMRDAELGTLIRDVERVDAELLRREAELATGREALPPIEQAIEDVRTIVTERQPGVVRANRTPAVPEDALDITDTLTDLKPEPVSTTPIDPREGDKLLAERQRVQQTRTEAEITAELDKISTRLTEIMAGGPAPKRGTNAEFDSLRAQQRALIEERRGTAERAEGLAEAMRRVEEQAARTETATPDPAVRIAELEARVDEVRKQHTALLDKLGRVPRAGSKKRAEYDLLRQEERDLKDEWGQLTSRKSGDAPAAEGDKTAPPTKGPRGEPLWEVRDGDDRKVNPLAMETLTEALENVKKSLGYGMQEAQWARLADALLEAGDRALMDNTRVWYAPNARGVWRPAFDKWDMPEIVMPGDAKGAAGLGRDIRVLVHEAVHALTVGRVQAVLAGKIDGPPQLVKAVRDLEKVYVQFRNGVRMDKVPIGQKFGPGDGYAAQNIDEFVAQALMDTQTQQRLLRMPSTNKYSFASLWDQLWSAIKRLVLGGEDPAGTALGDVLSQVETIIRVRDLPEGIDLGLTVSARMAPGSPQAHSAANVKFVARMYQHARDFLGANPIDPNKVETLANQVTKGGVRDVLVSDGLKLASSKNPIMQMLASLTTEVTTGAAGRRSTAAIQQHIYHNRIVGTSVLNYAAARMRWAKDNGGGYMEAMFKGEKFQQFDRLVAEEIMHRRQGLTGNGDPRVVEAADALQRLYQRSLETQKGSATLGSHYLPTDATGYMPQSLKGDALRNASPQELEELAEFLAGHWQNVYGWDHSFSKTFSDYYLRRARLRAAGQQGVDFVATESPSAAVHDTLEMMKLEMRDLNSKARAELDRVGAQPQNKKRLDVDMLHVLPNGKKVLDYYDTNALSLARQHARRVAGASALADFNVLGQRGVNNLLRAIDDAPAGLEATPEEREALERVFAEFLGVPWTGEYRNRFAAGASALTRLMRMGGLAFTQIGEYANAIHHLGLGTTLRSIGDLPRMMGEVRKGLNGQPLHNAWLESIDQWSGYALGTENFLNTTAFDPTDELLRAYGKGQNTVERLLQAGNYAQAKISFFRGVHAAQHRAMAERIVNKAVNYLSENTPKADKFLDDMGFNAEMRKALRATLPNAVKRDAAGNAVGFDLYGLGNAELMEDFVQAVQRGTHQIIQGTFIGERGAWAHNDVMKLVFQLRTFGLTSTEKQWARTRMVNGPGAASYGYAAGVLLGQMAFVLPIYFARVQVNSMGRPDREEYVDRALAPAAMIQALLNYSTSAGLAGDAFDQLASVAGGWNDDAKSALGTRSFSTGVGGIVPAFGTADAYLRLMQGKGDPAFALKQLPMSNLPYLQPIINVVREDK